MTKYLWLTLGRDAVLDAVGYCDADWASQPHRHSTSGYVFYFGGGVMSWSSKKQQVISLSSTEAEYVSSTHAAKEALWLRTFVSELRSDSPCLVTLNCDNQEAIALSKDNKFHARTKHIDLRYHFIRECVAGGRLTIDYVPTDENVSDIFTKPLPRAKFDYFVGRLGLREL